MRIRAFFWAAALGILLLPGCANVAAQEPMPASTLLQKPAPVFKLTDLNGQAVDLHALRGNVVLLNFWATWCAPCRAEMPTFAAWQTTYQARGLRVVGVSMDDAEEVKPEAVRKLIAKLKVNYPIVIGDEALSRLYNGVVVLPVTYLVDRKGVIRAEYRGESDLESMEHQIQQLLAEQP